MCDFEMRQITRIHSYVVQCTYSYDTSKDDLCAFLSLNATVCGIIAILIFGSGVSLFKAKAKKNKDDKMVQLE